MQGGDREGPEGYANISLHFKRDACPIMIGVSQHSISFYFPLNELMERECEIEGTLFSSKFVLFSTHVIRCKRWNM